MIDEKIFFDMVRHDPFPGALSQTQVNGMKAVLHSWDAHTPDGDLRWLANMLAQTMHETASQMIPIEEYGQGKGQPYGEIDPETGQGYWGRGFIQTTWKENYQKTDEALDLPMHLSTVDHADNMLRYPIAARAMYFGMRDGWYRADEHGPHTLGRYFSDLVDDPLNARSIINGDRDIVPSWSEGKTIGEIVAGYHEAFLEALKAASEPPRRRAA